MKKLIAMLLCFAMVAAFGTSAAFASPDYDAAARRVDWARGNREFSDHVLSPIESTLTKLITYVKAYENVKYDSSKSKDDVNEAKGKLQNQLNALGTTLVNNNPNIIRDFLSTYTVKDENGNIDKEETYKLQLRVLSSVYSLFNANSVTSTFATAWKSNIEAMEDGNLRWADKYEVQADFYLSERTKMDHNALVIGQAQIDAAYNLERAEKSAATAKLSALKAQATAKALIADTIKTAQDAAATAVANAQASAYKQLSDSYADAVEAFWAEVENAWF